MNAKIIDPNYDVPHYINNENRFIVQSFQSPGFPYLKAVKEFALTWYYENNNFYIQILSYHWISVTGSYVYGGAWQGIGKGIKLYNI
ncbi:hypothetical protein [Spiroplasma phoeniceum]|uniref:Uncharacterized protein n=1 Tax=Spiroplasma phoeniceum P40 TaxID=1276259 RepID=A0A345DR89_9MOLU|nr:hypothetical protein [Spiroplasma phoeniceum]AXF96730.1 hypothetical protein SDAV_001777 [Spiroplasma phoeniceum P40]